MDESIQDKTQWGYCLTDAESQPERPQSDLRLLNSPSFHLERFFINACMYLACDRENEEKVYKCMYPQPDRAKVWLKDFFWDHMKKDLSLAGRSLNLVLDELIVLLHMVSFSFLTQGQVAFNGQQFATKDDRQAWEDIFNKTYLLPILTNASQNINDANHEIRKLNTKEDENQSKIYFMAYELLNEDPAKKDFLYENEQFWRYRPIVTFDLMSIEINLFTNKEQFKVLKEFSKSILKLHLLENYSEIIRLVKMLQNLLNKAIFKHSARNKSIKDFMQTSHLPKDWTRQQVESSVKCLQNVWHYSKQHLNDHIRTSITRNASLVDFFSHEFNLDTKLSYFLPTLFGDGLYCYALVHYLSSIQNGILDYYHGIKKIKHFQTKSTDLFDNRDYLIITSKTNDLSRIVQANFSYDSKNLKCIFKYEQIESQIVDKYLRTKPNISLSSIPKFEYSDEITDFIIFKRLNDSVCQEPIDLNLQMEIVDDFKMTNELSEALNALKIIINYAMSTNSKSNESIINFLKKIYTNIEIKASEAVLKSKIVECCQLKHLKNIWILLMMKRSILYTINGQDPFEKLNSCFKSVIEVKINLNFDRTLVYSLAFISYQVIELVLSALHEDDLSNYDQAVIKDILDSINDLNLQVPENLSRLPENYPDLQSDIPLEHSQKIKMSSIYMIWKMICNDWKCES
jgi:hypothetical protein